MGEVRTAAQDDVAQGEAPGVFGLRVERGGFDFDLNFGDGDSVRAERKSREDLLAGMVSGGVSKNHTAMVALMGGCD